MSDRCRVDDRVAGLQSSLKRHTFPKGIQNHVKNEAKQIETPAQDTQSRLTGHHLQIMIRRPSLNTQVTEAQRGKMCLRVEGEQSPGHLQGLNLNGKLWGRWKREDLLTSALSQGQRMV